MSTNAQTLFSNNLKRLRDLIGLTREELAELADISPQNVAKIEGGKRFVSAEGLEKLCCALKVPPAELFREEQKTDKLPIMLEIEDLLKYQSESSLTLLRDLTRVILKNRESER